MKKITFKTGARIVLKSPAHSFRIDLLLDVFPMARFVCMLRDPYTVFASTNHLWRSLVSHNRLQNIELGDLHELTFARYLKLFHALQREKERIPEKQYHEVRFEDLETNPIKTLSEIYEQLDLGDFNLVQPAIQKFLRAQGSYQKNVFNLTAQEREEVARRWEVAFREYGYPK